MTQREPDVCCDIREAAARSDERDYQDWHTVLALTAGQARELVEYLDRVAGNRW